MTGFFFTFLFSFLITPLVIKIYRSQNWLDDPKEHHHAKVVHKEAVPRGGGIVIFLSILISSLIFLQVDKYLIGILLGALVLTIVGFFDDLFDLHPLIRVFTGILAVLIVVGSGIGIAYISNPFGAGVIHLNQPQISFEMFNKLHTIWILADLFALIFVLWNMNIVNWSKGVDGQLPGFVAISALIIASLSQRFVDDPTAFNTTHLALIVSAAFFGFLPWNFYPQKIMPGYGAGSLAGFFLSILAILSGAKVATTLMVLAVPTADAVFTIMRRVRAGKSPFWGDRGHLHHKLMDVLGWGKRRIAIFYWASSLFLGILSLYLNTLAKIVVIGFVMIFVFGFLIWAKYKQSEFNNIRSLLKSTKIN